MCEFVIGKYIEISIAINISINTGIVYADPGISSLLQYYDTIEEAMIGSMFIYL